jgi:ATP-dependent RNA helicase DeaD
MLFSATIPAPIQKLAMRFMKDPVTIGIKTKTMTVAGTEQTYFEVNEKQKFDVLSRLLDLQLPELAIVFVRTKRRVDELSRALKDRGYPAEGIHGDLLQSKRDSVMRAFKKGTTAVLVATDVAARGLDISGVTHVYNFDIPQDPDNYVHRVGRTGRAGKKGMAVTFVTLRELSLLHFIERVTRQTIARQPIPTADEAFEGKQQALVDSLLSVAGGTDVTKYRGLAQDLIDMNDPVVLLSAALKMLSKEKGEAPASVELTEDRPMRPRKERKRESRPDRSEKDRGTRDFEFRKRRSR